MIIFVVHTHVLLYILLRYNEIECISYSNQQMDIWPNSNNQNENSVADASLEDVDISS